MKAGALPVRWPGIPSCITNNPAELVALHFPPDLARARVALVDAVGPIPVRLMAIVMRGSTGGDLLR